MATNPNYAYGYGGYGQGTYGNQPIALLPVSYYLKLITSQYQIAPNFMSYAAALLKYLDDLSQLLVQMQVAYDLDNALGTQLDVLGTIIGQSRTMTFQPSNSVSPVLDDATYRLLLLARIAQNQWAGTIDSLQSVWSSLFPGGKIAIQDAQNMTATIILSGAFTSITKDLITNGLIVPRPAGVLYNFVFSALPVFGFDSNNAYVAGFDSGKWS